MRDIEEALAELSAAVAAQNFAVGELLELLAANGVIDRFAFLARLRDKAEEAGLPELQRNGLRDLIESVRRADDPELPSLSFNGMAAEVISLDHARFEARQRPGPKANKAS